VKFEVLTDFHFQGIFTVLADSEEQAKALVETSCWAGKPTYFTTAEDDVVSWNFPANPQKEVKQAKRLIVREKEKA